MFTLPVVLVGALVVFTFGVVASQKVKDALRGVPSHVRADLTALEVSVLGKLKSAQSAALADVKVAVGIQPPALVTATVSAAPPPTA